METHINEQIRHKELANDNTLHVVCVLSNPVRYHSRYRLAREHIERMRRTPNVELHVVEATFADRKPEIEVQEGGSKLTVVTRSEAWVKENLINLGVQHLLPRDWQYVAWIDADVEFRVEAWAQETLHQLQHCNVLQPWQQCVDLGRLGNALNTFSSFGFLRASGQRIQRWPDEPYKYGHSGFAWAATRRWWEQTRGLIDFAVLGSADHHMAWAMAGDVDASIHAKMAPSFFRRCHEWQERTARVTGLDIGFTPGRIEHHFHGPKSRRYYRERWQILVDCNYDPDKHLAYNSQGVIEIVDNAPLESAIRKYNRSRAEDSIEE